MFYRILLFLLTFSQYETIGFSESILISSVPRGCDEQTQQPHITVTTNQGGSLPVIKSQLVVPINTTSFIMNCTFHKPIKWDVDRNDMPNLAVTEETIRHFFPSTGPSPECYSTNLVFYEVREEITGSYECSEIIYKHDIATVWLFPGQRSKNSTGFVLRRGRIDTVTGSISFPSLEMDCSVTLPAVPLQFYYANKLTSNSSEWTLIPEKEIALRSGSQYFVNSAVGKSLTHRFMKCQTDIPGDFYILHVLHTDIQLQPKPGVTDVLTLSTSIRQQFKCESWLNVTMTVVESIPNVKYDRIDTVSNKYFTTIVTLDYSGGVVSDKIGVIQCNSGNGTLHTWKHRLFDDAQSLFTSIGFFIDKNTRRATCFTTAVQDARILFVTAGTRIQSKFKETCTEYDESFSCPDQLLLSAVETTALSISVILPPVSGIATCHSLDVKRSFHYFLKTDEKTIRRFAPNEDLAYAEDVSHKISCSTRNLKIADSLECKCTFSKRLFAFPIVPVVPMNNGTLQFIPFSDVPFTPSELLKLSFHYKLFRVNVPSAYVRGVSCMGFSSESPNHYLATWSITPKQHNLKLHGHGEMSEIHITDDQSVVNISCLAISFPTPQITWNISEAIFNSASTQIYEKIRNDSNTSSRSIESTLTLSVMDALNLQNIECKAEVNQIAIGGEIHYLSKTFRFQPDTLQSHWSQATVVAVSTTCVAVSLLFLCVIFIVIKAKRQHSPPAILSGAEINYFLNGNPNIRGDGGNGYENAQRMAFAGTKYQLELSCLKIHRGMILGSGAYGVVLKGSVPGTSSTEILDVAVKMVKPNTDIEYFKALLGELKVMTYIGKHPHIAELIGAVATKLTTNQLYVVLSFYSNGSLKDYLKNNRKNFIHNTSQHSKSVEKHANRSNYVNCVSGCKTITTQDLVKWSYEIALGMDFLVSKKVIHGDLAARNVLLDESRQVKISDFGLARQLYNYSLYVKKSKVPLPWRWMSIEAICKMTFSSKSDVWAYGVTVWEIFSLGEQPFPVIDFDLAFINFLKNGNRLSRPELASEQIYNHIMHPTWKLDPETRPTFFEISNIWESFLNETTVALN